MLDMDKPLSDITVNLDSGILFVDGVPDCFLTPLHALAHFESWANVAVDVNVEGDSYADADAEDYSGAVTINYDCVAWQ
jgi:hypothetical protein